MAEESAANRTEQPTPERLRRARREGQVPTSQEVGTALMVLGLLVTLALAGPWLLRWFLDQMQQGLALAPTADGAGLPALLKARALSGLVVLLPFLAAAGLVSVVGSLLAAGGWNFAPQAVKFRFDRLAPGKGLGELFSFRSGVQIVVSLAKLAALSLLACLYLRDRLEVCLRLSDGSPGEILRCVAQLSLGLMGRIAAALAAIAALELLYQRLRYKRRLRMTRQEVKEERRQYEISPEIRSRIRSIQFEMARRRMLREVPKADVVLANPTHVAVALRYEKRSMQAPVVVAKGAELLAEKIKEIARAHQVPVLERPELARSLYQAVDVGASIPESLFVAVAEILAMIYRLRKGRALAQV